MTDPTPTPQAPPQGLTDAQLLELMPQQFQDDLATVSRLAAYGTPTEPGLYRVSLNTGALAYARAAIAAHEAAHEAARIGLHCYLDDDGSRPSSCVFDDPAERISDCTYAQGLQRDGEPKTACPHYRAATVEAAPAPAPTPEEVEARFRSWWGECYPNVPAGRHAVRSHVAFALHLLGGEVV